MARRRRPLARGWYEKKGDPPGTERFWDGEQWGPNPRQKRVKASAGGKAQGKPKTPEPSRSAKPVGANEVAADDTAASPGDAVELTQGSVWARISARSADMVLVLLPWYWLWIRAFSSETVEGADGAAETVTTTNVWWLWLAAGVVIAYDAGFTTKWGATPGKRFMGLIVADGETLASPPGWGKAFMRATPLLLLVAVLLVPLLWVGCVVAMFFDRKQRSIFDFSAGTVVLVDPDRPQGRGRRRRD